MDEVPYIGYRERKEPNPTPNPTPMPKILNSTKNGFTVEVIRAKITSNSSSTGKALVALFDRQTMVEKMVLETKDDNNKGFNKADALYMTRIGAMAAAKRASGENPGNWIPAKEMTEVRRRIGKYAKQLKDIYDGKR